MKVLNQLLFSNSILLSKSSKDRIREITLPIDIIYSAFNRAVIYQGNRISSNSPAISMSLTLKDLKGIQ